MKPEPGKFRRYFSPRARWREILALLVILLAIFFFRSERKELAAIGPQLQMAQQGWMLAGFTMAFICIVCQAGIYRMSFAAIGLRLPWGMAITLFLKRNFIGVFLPAGSVSALAYAPSQLRHAGFAKAQVHQGSGLFGFAGLLSTFIVGIPVIVFALLNHSIFKNVWVGLVALFAFIAGILWVARSLRSKGKLYNKIVSRFPSAGPALDEVFSANVHAARFGGAILFSLGVELSGILMLLAAMLALGHPASFGAAAMGYVVSILMMVASPFLKGLGAVELSMVYVLERSGYPAAAALSVTILYRVFEFWLPLFCGLLAFAWRGRRFFYRLAPALLTFALGIVNIISAITPPLHTRMRLLHEYLPLSAIHASNMLVLFIGLFLLITAAYLVRGLRSAWITALVFAVISLLGHIGKALDYEEAILAGITLVILLITASQYRFRSSQKWMVVGVKTALVSFVAVGIFAFISFYFIDEVHFGRDFTWQEALLHTGKAFLLMTDETLTPVTAFGHEFVRIIHWLGFITWSFFLFSLLRPGLRAVPKEEGARDKAAHILDSFGDSALDFFKLNKDKFYFFSEDEDGFVAFRVAEGFAVVLEEPVCAPSHKLDLLLEFERYCRRQGLKPAFYRVDESSLLWFARLHKQKLLIGQEGIVDVAKFSLEGRDKKSLRNGLNALQKKGITTTVHPAPQTPEMIGRLKEISDEWLKRYEIEEQVFSQGMFSAAELEKQDVITLQDADGHVTAFLNIVPDYAEDEITYDMIRKTDDAPPAAMDALIIELIAYARERGQLFVNLGMTPMMGIEQPENTAEQLIKFTSKLKRFQHYKGLREFKEKYATIWENKYLVYGNDFDLLQLPFALNAIMKT